MISQLITLTPSELQLLLLMFEQRNGVNISIDQAESPFTLTTTASFDETKDRLMRKGLIGVDEQDGRIRMSRKGKSAMESKLRLDLLSLIIECSSKARRIFDEKILREALRQRLADNTPIDSGLADLLMNLYNKNYENGLPRESSDDLPAAQGSENIEEGLSTLSEFTSTSA